MNNNEGLIELLGLHVDRVGAARDPSWLGQMRTELANVFGNDVLVALAELGGRRPAATLRLPGPTVSRLYCACSDIIQFSQMYDPAENSNETTPGNPLLDVIMNKVAERGNRWAPGGDFLQALRFLDHNHANISPTEKLKVALALKLRRGRRDLRPPGRAPEDRTSQRARSAWVWRHRTCLTAGEE